MLFNKDNALQEKGSAQERKLYTGVGLFKFLCVNPSKSKLEAMGYKPKEEPSYFGEDYSGEVVAKNTFYFEHIPNDTIKDNFKIRFTINCSDKVKESSTNKFLFSSGYGKGNQLEVSSYMETNVDYYKYLSQQEWYKTPQVDISELHSIRVGEEELVNLLTNMFNFKWTENEVNEKGEVKTTVDGEKIIKYNNFLTPQWKEIWNNISKGDMKWLEENIAQLGVTPEIVLGIAVNQKEYQDVYIKYFGRDINNSYTLNAFRDRLNPDSMAKSADSYYVGKMSDVTGELLREYKRMTLGDTTTPATVNNTTIII